MAALIAALAFVVAQPALSAAAAPVRIMPLGDSITGSPGCWRALLWNRLQNTGYTDIDFVGTLPRQRLLRSPYDGDNEGHGGFLATNIADQNQLPPWLAAATARHRAHALRHQRRVEQHPAATILAAYTKLVGPDAGQQPGHEDPRRADHPDEPVQLRRVRRSVVDAQQRDPGLGRRQDHRAVADHRGRPVDRLQHGHRHLRRRAPERRRRPEDGRPLVPGAGGALSAAHHRRRTTPTTTHDHRPRRSAPAPRRYRVVSQWHGRLPGRGDRRNNASAPTTGWTATLAFADGQQLNQSWNATASQSGSTVTARNLSWNGAPATGRLGLLRLPGRRAGLGPDRQLHDGLTTAGRGR